MPGRLSGVDLAHVVAKRFPGAGIIVASGRLTASDVELPKTAEFFSKPYSFFDIVARLNAPPSEAVDRQRWKNAALM